MKYPIAEAARKLRDHPYRTEAENIIEVATGRKPTGVESITTLRVADWLREFVAAYASGCTGLASDPDGPTLVGADPVTSGAAVLADATDAEVDGFLGAVHEDHPDERPEDFWREARGAVPREPGSPRAEEVIRRLRDQTEPGI